MHCHFPSWGSRESLELVGCQIPTLIRFMWTVKGTNHEISFTVQGVHTVNGSIYPCSLPFAKKLLDDDFGLFSTLHRPVHEGIC